MTSDETILDQQLVAQSRTGSLSAFEGLVYRYEARIYRFVLQSCRNPDDAVEITQDTFVRAFNALDQFDGRFAFAPWLFAIARRKCLDFHRAKRPSSEAELPELPDWADPATLLSHREEKENLWAIAREKLSPLQYQALWLKYVEDMDVAEIARALDKTATHIKVLLFRARKILGKEIERRSSTDTPPQPIPARTPHAPTPIVI